MRLKHKENTLTRLVPAGQAMTNCAGVGIRRLPQICRREGRADRMPAVPGTIWFWCLTCYDSCSINVLYQSRGYLKRSSSAPALLAYFTRLPVVDTLETVTTHCHSGKWQWHQRVGIVFGVGVRQWFSARARHAVTCHTGSRVASGLKSFTWRTGFRSPFR